MTTATPPPETAFVFDLGQDATTDSAVAVWPALLEAVRAQLGKVVRVVF